MRILIVSTVPTAFVGGVNTEARQLIAGLVRRGHPVALAADQPLDTAPDLPFYPLDAGWTVSPGIADRLTRALADFQPDVVHVITAFPRLLKALREPLAGTRWIVTVHSIPPFESALSGCYAWPRLRRFLRRLREARRSLAWTWLLSARWLGEVVVHSQTVQTMALARGVRRTACTVIPLFMADPASLPAPREAGAVGQPLRLVSLAAITWTKGFHDLVDAMALLQREGQDARLEIIGAVRDERYRQHLHEQIDRLGLRDRIVLRHHLSDAEVGAALGSADVFVQPSLEEGFCLSYMEALMTTPRVVGTHTGAIPEMSAGDPGVRVVPPGAPRALAEAIAGLARAPVAADVVGQRRSRLGQAFSLSGYLDAHETLYEQLVSSSR